MATDQTRLSGDQVLDYALAMQHFSDVVATLRSDLDAMNLIEASGHVQDEQPLFRAQVRSMFAFIEGTIWSLKVLLFQTPQVRHTFTTAELLALDEYSVEIKDGEARRTRLRLSFQSNLMFTFKLAPKVIGFDWKPDYGHDGWAALRSMIKVRDRLMHPKGPESLQVTSSEMQLGQRAMDWYSRDLQVIINAADELWVRDGFDRILEEVPPSDAADT